MPDDPSRLVPGVELGVDGAGDVAPDEDGLPWEVVGWFCVCGFVVAYPVSLFGVFRVLSDDSSCFLEVAQVAVDW